MTGTIVKISEYNLAAALDQGPIGSMLIQMLKIWSLGNSWEEGESEVKNKGVQDLLLRDLLDII